MPTSWIAAGTMGAVEPAAHRHRPVQVRRLSEGRGDPLRPEATPTTGARPKIDDLVFAITPDASVRLQKLKAGECHLMPYPNPADLEAMKADPNLKWTSRKA
jgi:ABC-type transport system substrate-binding protein